MYLGYDGTYVYYEYLHDDNTADCLTSRIEKEELEGHYTIVSHNFDPVGCTVEEAL